MELQPVDLIVEGGTVVTDAWTAPATVVVADGRIVSLLEEGASTAHLAPDRRLDATGLLVLPGAVDPHCHIAVPLGEFLTLDSFETATLAALAGGTTTIVDFAIPTPGEHPLDALRSKLALGAVIPRERAGRRSAACSSGRRR